MVRKLKHALHCGDAQNLSLLCVSILMKMKPIFVEIFKNSGNLYEELLADYEPLERPVENSSEAVLVKMGLVLQQIVDVDEKNQVVDVNAWLKFSWLDYSLKWKPEEYGGVSDLRFRKAQLWTPDVLMYNSADPQFDSRYASNLLVYPNGLVNWMPPGLYRLSCKIQVVWFPFDVQECFLKFGSWTFDGTKLNLEIDENGFDISNYMQNGEWTLEETTVKRNIQYYECCPEPYYDLVFTFVIRRRALFYAFNLILPCILITMLTLVGFTFPPDAGEKMSLRECSSGLKRRDETQTTDSVASSRLASLCNDTRRRRETASPRLALPRDVTIRDADETERRHATQLRRVFRLVMLEWIPWLLLMHRPGFIAKKGSFRKEDESDDEFEERQTRLDQQKIATLISQITVESNKPTPTFPHRVTIVDELLTEDDLEDEEEEADIQVSVDQKLWHPPPVVPPEQPAHLWWNASNRMGNRVPLPVPVEQIAQLLVLQQVHSHLSEINKHIRDKEKSKKIEDDWKFSAMFPI
uniref:Neur_chan_LBD domain-containing protein n=2 Tax=Caenorhabditis japonica TaxID=281687 RepID=A0A8R1I3H1_CAEJA